MKKTFLFTLIATIFLSLTASADEGMWFLPYLQKMNYKEMKAKGLKLKAEDIYSANSSSLKDCIVIFGGGCTGEIVSNEGLVFTNHHCGYSSIQKLSSVDHDYLKNGFWAMNRGEEIPAPGLAVRFVRSIADVTDQIIGNVPDNASEDERNEIVKVNIAELAKKMQDENEGKSISIERFFGGNQYFSFVIEVYNDVRFVGAPPSSIGKFGGETDNWMWPRHTGDFSVFRVYASPDGKPADYSADNVPLSTPKHLAVSTKGYKPDDFAMIMGFPGSTNRYMTSYEIDYTLSTDNPNRIYIRGERQNILSKQMQSSDKIRIQYASKYAGSSNYWKNSIGMSKALVKLDVKGKKMEQEADFVNWYSQDQMRTEKYQNALSMIKNSVEKRTPQGTMQILAEAILSPVEIAMMPFRSRLLMQLSGGEDQPSAEQLEQIKAELKAAYKDYDMTTDKLVAKRMLQIVKDKLDKEDLPSFYETIDTDFGGNIDSYVDYLYDNSSFATEERAIEFIDNYDAAKYKDDPAFTLYRSTVEKYMLMRSALGDIDKLYNEGHRLYIAGLLEKAPNEKHYSDANFTIRLTYGTVQPYDPADAVKYNYFTTLEGVMQKEDENNPVEFTVPDKLKELYASKDFGRYADKDGKMHVAFLTTNDITGGNSGSPVLNGKGELIGLAFDGNWESMSGDICFEPELQRCINVDVRYVLFIIDKFGGAGYLLDEMTLD